MRGQVVVLTGATSGIGRVAAEQLAARGARLVLVARDAVRIEATLDALRTRGPGVAHSAYRADLSRLADMKRVAAEIAAAEPRIDVLINNAGALFGSRQVTEDGLEKTFALNHLSYFVLALGLRARLVAGSRVINVASASHRRGRLEWDDLQSARRYAAFRAYALSKLCNLLFTRELARRWAAGGIVACSLHPGFVATRFGAESGGLLSWAVRVAQWFALTPEQGAETLVYLATVPFASAAEAAQANGEYFVKCRRKTPAPAARDDAAALRLWKESERLTGVSG
jgi:NAD(P)-dependent dehydrogenase (short-subunit alcohol dehydrogenase family)